jgi:hypothetical protein
VLLTRSPVSTPRRVLLPRLACVRRAASVRPEPGSNSPLEICKRWTRRSADCRSVDGERTMNNDQRRSLPDHGCLIQFKTAGVDSTVRNQCQLRHLISRLTPIPKAGFMCTDFWHTVQFSRSGVRWSPSSSRADGSKPAFGLDREGPRSPSGVSWLALTA